MMGVGYADCRMLKQMHRLTGCRGLMHETAFASDYVALTKDGAEWIVNNTAIDMVGIDYTSIATYEDLPGPHHVLLSKVRQMPSLPRREQHCSALQRQS